MVRQIPAAGQRLAVIQCWPKCQLGSLRPEAGIDPTPSDQPNINPEFPQASHINIRTNIDL